MVVWNQYLLNVADFMNVTATEAGIIVSLMLIIALTLIVMVAARGNSGLAIVIPVFDFFLVIFFTIIGWFPTWTGSVIALVLAILIGYLFNRMFGVT